MFAWLQQALDTAIAIQCCANPACRKGIEFQGYAACIGGFAVYGGSSGCDRQRVTVPLGRCNRDGDLR